MTHRGGVGKGAHRRGRRVFEELGHAPDFIVTDAAAGTARAIAGHLETSRTVLVPSPWHVSNAV